MIFSACRHQNASSRVPIHGECVAALHRWRRARNMAGSEEQHAPRLGHVVLNSATRQWCIETRRRLGERRRDERCNEREDRNHKLTQLALPNGALAHSE